MFGVAFRRAAATAGGFGAAAAASSAARAGLFSSLAGGGDAPTQTQFLRRVKVANYSVLGSQLINGSFRDAVGPPKGNEALVDPAGLPYVSGELPMTAAGAASGAIYKWLQAGEFPAEVANSVRAPCDAKHFAYDAPDGKRHVVHVVGPDFRQRDYTDAESLQTLATAYENVLREVVVANVDSVRLLPVSGGVFSNGFSDDMHHLTWAALARGYSNLSDAEKRRLAKVDVKMCIFVDKHLAPYIRAHTWAANRDDA